MTGALAQGTKDNEALRVFAAAGYDDLTTSYFATRYMLEHSGIDSDRLTIKDYHGGPHKSDLRYYFTDSSAQTGYVSNDMLRNHEGQVMWWTDSSRKTMTTQYTGIPVYVRVGPYNVNPESAVEKMSVIAHEYGHSLGLPDFYSTGTRATMGTWELMASDHAQFMTVFSRQDLGWIVPVEASDGLYTLRESKKDTGTITWKRPDGTPYTLTGPGIHNADALRVQLPKVLLIDSVPTGVRAWHSGAGDDFGCPGHTLDVFLPDLVQRANATAITLKFKSLYEMEWDWDYGFVLASTDGGQTWTSLASKKGTTLSAFNPNNNACNLQYGNFITGVSGEQNTLTNTNRHTGAYPAAQWIDDEFDLTPFKGQELLLRFAYATDPAVSKRGWFIDDINITADGAEVYKSSFESSDENTRLFSSGWARVSSADGLDNDHAYYVEVRDRIGWDKDGKGQSERGDPTWAPGVAILYTDENHGYGNTGASDQPAQTVVDSQPQPGNETPNLDDAAYTTQPNDNEFDGCTHIDNYKTATSDTWKLPAGIDLTVTALNGFSNDGVTSNLTATVIADVKPDCSIVKQPPVLHFGAGHTEPDTDGKIELAWDRPAGAIGPDEIQEATFLASIVSDDAESGLGKWITSTEGTGAFNWETSSLKSSSGKSFWARAAEGATAAASTLTYAQPIDVPAAGTANLEFSDWSMNESDDKVVVEVQEAESTEWVPVYESARSALAPDAAIAFADEPMIPQSISLSAYKGKTIRLRFRFIVGPENKPGSTPMGWYVDDIRIESSNWYDLATTAATSYTRNGVSTGKYYYRVRTKFAAGPVGVPSGWSNVVSTQVYYTPSPDQGPDLVVAQIFFEMSHDIEGRMSITALIANTGERTAPPSKTKFLLDGNTLLGIIDTPSLAAHGWVEVTVQLDTNGRTGQHTIDVTADDANDVDESNETNNGNTTTIMLP